MKNKTKVINSIEDIIGLYGPISPESILKKLGLLFPGKKLLSMKETIRLQTKRNYELNKLSRMEREREIIFIVDDIGRLSMKDKTTKFNSLDEPKNIFIFNL